MRIEDCNLWRKATNVITSCETVDQLKVAKRYFGLVSKSLNKSKDREWILSSLDLYYEGKRVILGDWDK